MVSAMSSTRLTSREFNQDTGRAKQAARKGPVVITDRGVPANVLLSYRDYQRLVAKGATLVDALALPAAQARIGFEPPKLDGPLQAPRDLA